MKPSIPRVSIHFCLDGSICVFYDGTRFGKAIDLSFWHYHILKPRHAGGFEECSCRIQEWLDKQKEKC